MATITVTTVPPVALSPNLNAVATPRRSSLRDELTQFDNISIRRLKQIHSHIIRTRPPPEHHPGTFFLYSRLFHYCSLQDLDYCLQLFNQIPNPNSFIYNTLIRAYACSKDHKWRAFLLFQEMLEMEGVFPDKHTFPFVLKSCAYLFSLVEGKQIHSHLLKDGLGSDVYINNSLIHFYASCGCSESARKVFDKMSERSLVSWNVMIDALVQVGEFDEALRLFREMGCSFSPDGYTIQSVIDACAGLATLSLGMWIHAYVLKKCEMDSDFDLLVKNSLVEMYCKCGSLRLAEQVFKRIRKRDVNSWNVMILGFAMHGKVERVFDHFKTMVDEENLLPNSITFLGLLSACNHRGLVEEGSNYFDTMVNQYKIEPVLQHYGCLLDLLASHGKMDQALEIVSSMPMKPDGVIWRSLVDATCLQSEGFEMSEEMAKQMMISDEQASSGDYVLLSKVYALANRWNEVGLVRKLMMDKGIGKEPGCTSIEINGTVHEFFAGDTSHLQKNQIYQFLDVIYRRLEAEGHVIDLSPVATVDGNENGKVNSLRAHSERLAIAFGLMNLKPGIPIRVFKNLRVCNDCHNVTKLISRMYNVEIVMRDRIRFHHFRDGFCSCEDFW